tara:strand:+ start:2811 stop:3077 length:267 start_codon:yes stop_codon:yes gene_type:complete
MEEKRTKTNNRTRLIGEIQMKDPKEMKDWWREPKNKDLWLNELIEKATDVVEGYEQYLLNRVNYDELAKLVKELRSILPISTPNDKEE